MTAAAALSPEPREHILVIKLGALGDFIQALGPAAAIRRHHAGAHITVLTGASCLELAQAAPYFDAVWRDDRAPVFSPRCWWHLRRRLRGGRFDRVYDLQTTDRTGLYFHLMGPGARAQWSGIARGCSHPHANPARDRMHTLDRQAEQLAMAGIGDVPAPDVAWLSADVGSFDARAPYALLVPGGAAGRPAKRWPAASYIALARALVARGRQVLLIGGAPETALLAAIAEACPGARDLGGRTSLGALAGLARGAAGAIGNDTGPMHLIAAVGCPVTVLFSAASDPALCAPPAAPGQARARILRCPVLADLALEPVLAAFDETALSFG